MTPSEKIGNKEGIARHVKGKSKISVSEEADKENLRRSGGKGRERSVNLTDDVSKRKS